jgi:hypothetical protein
MAALGGLASCYWLPSSLMMLQSDSEHHHEALPSGVAALAVCLEVCGSQQPGCMEAAVSSGSPDRPTQSR